MLREILRLLGADLDRKLADIRAQVEEFRATTTNRVTAQIKETGLMVGFALVGTIAACATFVIVLVALYRWVEMYKGPFAALAAVGAVMAILTIAMFVLAFRWRSPGSSSAVANAHPTAASAPPSPPLSEGVPVALSAALPPPPSNASPLDLLMHRFSTRVAGAGDEAIEAAVHLMRTGSKSALFGTLTVVVLVGVLLGRRR